MRGLHGMPSDEDESIQVIVECATDDPEWTFIVLKIPKGCEIPPETNFITENERDFLIHVLRYPGLVKGDT